MLNLVDEMVDLKLGECEFDYKFTKFTEKDYTQTVLSKYRRGAVLKQAEIGKLLSQRPDIPVIPLFIFVCGGKYSLILETFKFGRVRTKHKPTTALETEYNCKLSEYLTRIGYENMELLHGIVREDGAILMPVPFKLEELTDFDIYFSWARMNTHVQHLLFIDNDLIIDEERIAGFKRYPHAYVLKFKKSEVTRFLEWAGLRRKEPYRRPAPNSRPVPPKNISPSVQVMADYMKSTTKKYR